MRVGIVTDAVEQGPVSIGVYTKNVVETILDISDVELVLIHSSKGCDPLYEKAEEVVLPVKRPSQGVFPSFVHNQYSNLFHYHRYRAQLRKARIDVMHMPNMGRPAPPVSSLFLESKLVVTNHGMAQLSLSPRACYGKRVTSQRIRDYEEYVKWKLLFRTRCDRIITVSESEKRIISHYLSIPPEKIHVIYHGVSDDFTLLPPRTVKKTLEKFRIESPFILHASAYQPKKNVTRLLTAFNNLKTEHTLVMVGSHKQDDAITNVKQDKIIFTGFIDIKELVSLYNAADVFAFPSLHESFGMPILEAMACGCPVLTSNVCSMPEVAGDAAYLVDPYSTDEITDALYTIVTDDNLKAHLKKKGLERVQQFSWKKSAEEHINVYKEVGE
jgi:glycosyltransferase involved in cell wall biosynthesis